MFVDTNVLVAARFTSAPDHETACVNVDRAADAEPLCVSRQILREYLATMTRPQIWSKPLGMTDALADIRRLVSRFGILEDGPRVMEVLAGLCREVPVAGKQVHDANVAATMIAHGEWRLMTFNARDFRRYGDRLELVEMAAA